MMIRFVMITFSNREPQSNKQCPKLIDWKVCVLKGKLAKVE